MKSTRSVDGIRFAGLAVLGAMALLASACARAEAQEKKPYGPGVTGASTSATALPARDVAPPASSSRGPWDPDRATLPLPTEVSKAPGIAEWRGAPDATEARVAYAPCRVQRIREWYRVSCRAEKTIEMISGSVADLTIDCHHEGNEDMERCDEVYAIFPARRGDRRALEVFDWGRWGLVADAVVTEQFIDGDTLPMVSVQGVRSGF